VSRRVTVDTGGPDDVFPGAIVTWLHTPRGGYGYTMPVDAKVISHSRHPRTRVRIEVRKRNGEVVERFVDAANLRWRSP
jgi:hypothetical protein